MKKVPMRARKDHTLGTFTTSARSPEGAVKQTTDYLNGLDLFDKGGMRIYIESRWRGFHVWVLNDSSPSGIAPATGAAPGAAVKHVTEPLDADETVQEPPQRRGRAAKATKVGDSPELAALRVRANELWAEDRARRAEEK
jgi:hypothetical protein